MDTIVIALESKCPTGYLPLPGHAASLRYLLQAWRWDTGSGDGAGRIMCDMLHFFSLAFSCLAKHSLAQVAAVQTAASFGRDMGRLAHFLQREAGISLSSSHALGRKSKFGATETIGRHELQKLQESPGSEASQLLPSCFPAQLYEGRPPFG